jgi:hypothetical protein
MPSKSKSPAPKRVKAAVAAAAPAAAAGLTGVGVIDDHMTFILMVVMYAAGIFISNGFDVASLKNCSNWMNYAKSGNADAAVEQIKAFWPFGLVLTGHVFNSVVTGGSFVHDCSRTVFAAFGGGIVMNFVAGNGFTFDEHQIYICAFAWWFSTSKWSALITNEVPDNIKAVFADYNALCTAFFCTTAVTAAAAASGDKTSLFFAGDTVQVDFGSIGLAVLTAMAFEGFPLKGGWKLNLDPSNYASVGHAVTTAVFISTSLGGPLAPVDAAIDAACKAVFCSGGRTAAAFWLNIFAYLMASGAKCPFNEKLALPLVYINQGIDLVFGL